MTLTGVTRAAAATAITGGATAAAVAIALLPEPWTQYVSEAGVSGAPTADLYLTGLLLLGAGIGLLAAALARLSWPVWVPLLVAVPMIATSGLVPCTAGCPLPPYEPTTAADLLHAGASILAIVAALATMLTLIFLADRPALERGATIGFLVATPQAAALLVSMLAVGRGTPTAILERFLLVSLVAWILWTTAKAGPASARSPDRQPSSASSFAETGASTRTPGRSFAETTPGDAPAGPVPAKLRR